MARTGCTVQRDFVPTLAGSSRARFGPIHQSTARPRYRHPGMAPQAARIGQFGPSTGRGRGVSAVADAQRGSSAEAPELTGEHHLLTVGVQCPTARTVAMYHATLSLNVERIMREGFKDRSGTAGFLGANLDPPFPPGVWLSTEPALDHPLFDRVTDSSLVMEQEIIEVRVPVPELLDVREHANWTWRAGRQFLMPAALGQQPRVLLLRRGLWPQRRAGSSA